MSESYPLEQVLDVKKKRVEDAEKVVKEKEAALEKAQSQKDKAQQAYDKVKQHQQDKMNQLRNALDEGTTSDEIIQMKNYLKVVEENLATELKKVQDAEKVVNEKKAELETAKEIVKEKQKEVDKLVTHRQHWAEEIKKEQEQKEAKEQDELGSIMFSAQKRKNQQ